MSSENFKKIEHCLHSLKDPRVYGWSLYPMAREIISEYQTLPEEERAAVGKLIRDRLSLQVPLLVDWWKDRLPTKEDEWPLDSPPELLEFSVALYLCSYIAVPEAKDALFTLLERGDVQRDWRTLSEVLAALGNLKLSETLPIFRKYVASLSDPDPSTSWLGLTAVISIAKQDLSQALTHLPSALNSDLSYRSDLSGQKGNYHSSEILLEKLFELYGEKAIQPISQQILKLDPQLQAFAHSIVDMLLAKSTKLIQDFGSSRGQEYVRGEQTKQQLILQLKQVLKSRDGPIL